MHCIHFYEIIYNNFAGVNHFEKLRLKIFSQEFKD